MPSILLLFTFITGIVIYLFAMNWRLRIILTQVVNSVCVNLHLNLFTVILAMNRIQLFYTFLKTVIFYWTQMQPQNLHQLDKIVVLITHTKYAYVMTIKVRQVF